MRYFIDHIKIIFIVSTICLFTACSSIKYLPIETYNPASVTFPDNVTRVLIVNNALPQSPETGYKETLFGKPQENPQAETDSALYDACRMLGKSIVEADYFNDVLLYDYPTRTDDQFLVDLKLSPEKVEELCRETETDAIISLDRLLFVTKKDVSALANDGVAGTISITMEGILRAYLPERIAPLATLTVADSMMFLEYAPNLETLKYFLPEPDTAIRIAGEYVGSKVYSTFVPHWKEDTRWYYTGQSSHWKEASAFASAGKWENAGQKWQSIYERLSDGKTKAKVASNLALSEEMEGHFEKAHEWAVKSHELFKEYAGKDAKETNLLAAYIMVLIDRGQSDKKLNIQFGQE